MLKSALNRILSLHSRSATLKRLGAANGADLYSPIKVTPSNYSRFLRGPEYTTIPGKEFVIPVDSILGQPVFTFEFSGGDKVSGDFKIEIGSFTTTPLAYNSTSEQIRQAISALDPSLSHVKVTGTMATGFTVTFEGVKDIPGVPSIKDITLSDGTLDPIVVSYTRVGRDPWPGDIVKKGDRILLEDSKVVAIDEVMEMPDFGGKIMAYRVRCD